MFGIRTKYKFFFPTNIFIIYNLLLQQYTYQHNSIYFEEYENKSI